MILDTPLRFWYHGHGVGDFEGFSVFACNAFHAEDEREALLAWCEQEFGPPIGQNQRALRRAGALIGQTGWAWIEPYVVFGDTAQALVFRMRWC